MPKVQLTKRKWLLSPLAAILILTLYFLPASAGHARQAPRASLRLADTTYLPIVSNQKPLTFIAWADTRSGNATLTQLSAQASTFNPVFTLFPGDLEPSGFTTTGMDAWKKAINGGGSSGLFDLTFPLRGNHDTSNVSGWQAYFDTQATAGRVGAGQFSTLTSELTYSFEYKNAVFIGIDVPGDVTMITAEQIAYLDGVLSAAESRGQTHAFLFLHGPIYPVSSHTSCGERTCPTPTIVGGLVNVLNKHPIVSAVFNGHEHLQSYVHLDSSRVPEITHPFEEFIAGSAGASLHNCNKTYRFDFCGAFPGFAVVNVFERTFSVQIYQLGNSYPVKTYSFTKP
jgi:hypothetical protein